MKAFTVERLSTIKGSTMRELIYAVEGKAANLRTFAVDEPGHGGACHEYLIAKQITLKLPDSGEVVNVPDLENPLCRITFQSGPINADNGGGVNGVQNEDILAVVIDRLEGFQKGPYKCEDNALAMDACREALGHLQRRTRQRVARGVEGTHEV